MRVFELEQPGTWLISGTDDTRKVFKALLSNIQLVFYEANVALNMFEDCRSKNLDVIPYDKNKWQQDIAHRKLCENKIIETYHLDPIGDIEEIEYQSAIMLKRNKWVAGDVPMNHIDRYLFIYAKAFIYALDEIYKCVRELKKFDGVHKNKIIEICDLIEEKLPKLSEVRNSSQHMEERVHGLGAHRKPLHEDGGALWLSNLEGTRFTTTINGGKKAEVDISCKSLEHMRDIVQQTLEAFEWEGPKVHLPN